MSFECTKVIGPDQVARRIQDWDGMGYYQEDSPPTMLGTLPPGSLTRLWMLPDRRVFMVLSPDPSSTWSRTRIAHQDGETDFVSSSCWVMPAAEPTAQNKILADKAEAIIADAETFIRKRFPTLTTQIEIDGEPVSCES